MEYDIKFDNNEHGTKRYYKKGTYILHREDGPAIEWWDGSKSWYINGFLHRTNGPAVKCKNGSEAWYINGFLHRTNGPAIDDNGYKEWWINGKHLSPEKEAILNKWWDNKNC